MMSGPRVFAADGWGSPVAAVTEGDPLGGEVRRLVDGTMVEAALLVAADVFVSESAGAALVHPAAARRAPAPRAPPAPRATRREGLGTPEVLIGPS
jgi:hypothetical protein